MLVMRSAHLLLLLSVTGAPGLIAQQACADIASFDFRNGAITAAAEPAGEFYGVFNGPGPGGTFRMRDGRFNDWDGPPELANKSKPDWLTEIESDILVHPPQCAGVRVLSVIRLHLTGTG